MSEITYDLIRATVSPGAFAAAQAYLRSGRVISSMADPETDRITAVVRGSASRPYRQTINLRQDRAGKWRVAGECTCPVGANCKHVAAALLAQLGREAPGTSRAAALQVSAAKPCAASPVATGPTLDPALAHWLRGISEDHAAESEDYPKGVYKRLFYQLGQVVLPQQHAPLLRVTLAAADVKNDGVISENFIRTSLQKLLYSGQTPKYVRPSDRAILHHIGNEMLSDRYREPEVTLRQILATRRARVGGFPGSPAREGEARGAVLQWRLAADGSQRPVLEIDGGGQPVLLPAPWYLDAATGELGALQVDVPPRLLQRLLNAPPIPAEQAGAVGEALRAALPQAGLPVPRVLPHGGELRGKPTPHIRLHGLQIGGYHDFAEHFAAAALTMSFRYDNALISAGESGSDVVHEGVRYTVARNRAAENRAIAMLVKLDFYPLRRAAPGVPLPANEPRMVFTGRDPGSAWLDFMLDGLPMLRGMGWEVEQDADFPFRLIDASGPMHAELREGSGIDWFDLNLGVLFGDERIDLVPPLVTLLSGPLVGQLMRELRDIEGDAVPGRKIVLRLADGRRLALELARVAPILRTLFDLFAGGGLSAQDGRLGISRVGAAGVAALEQAGLAADLVWRGGEALRALGRQLRDRGGIPEAAVPGWFAASLRPYQQRGVDWLQFLREAGLAGVLADDMGLGKTVQALAHLAVEKQAGRLASPALVICPTSVVGNWAREAARFAPQLHVLPLQGTDRKSRFSEIGQSDIVISTYPLLARDEAVLAGREWHTLILDEAQTVKNPSGGMAQTVRRLRAAQRLCLTGTPMENHLGELWALFDFMMPGFLGSTQEFSRRFRTPIEKGGDTVLHAALAKRVAPFLLRRNKSEVATELPPRTDIVETIQMLPAQRAIYEAIRLAMHARVQAAIAEQGLARSGIVILDALLKLRQACCDPRLLKIAGEAKKKAGSAKLDRLLELLVTLHEEGRSILLFSQFTSMLALIEESVTALGMKYELLTGDTRDRTTPVDNFQAGRCKLFLVSLKAGGVGLNLTAADTVIHYDPWWNPAVENQATDRAHRIGQTKSVFVHRLITENSIEEKMEGLKARKSALAEGILGGAGASALRMTEADVAMLFG